MLESAAIGGRKVALRETAKRLLDRFNDEEVRPPPRGEAGSVEVRRGEGEERWWGIGVAPVLPAVAHTDQPLVTELVDLCGRGAGCGVALLSAERVRLLDFAEGAPGGNRRVGADHPQPCVA